MFTFTVPFVATTVTGEVRSCAGVPTAVTRTLSCTGPSATLVVSHVVLDELPLAIVAPFTRKA